MRKQNMKHENTENDGANCPVFGFKCYLRVMLITYNRRNTDGKKQVI